MLRFRFDSGRAPLRIVVDASLALSWFFEDERDEPGVAALRYVNENGALVPAIWSAEVGNGLLMGERRGRIDRDQIALIIEKLGALSIVVEMSRSQPAFPEIAAARTYGLTTYDASYLNLASLHGVPLATRDDRLARAAQALNALWQAPIGPNPET
jgi:predicted nucleic acid-binding protein